MGFTNRVIKKYCIFCGTRKKSKNASVGIDQVTRVNVFSLLFQAQHFLLKKNITNSHQFDYLLIQTLWRGKIIME